MDCPAGDHEIAFGLIFFIGLISIHLSHNFLPVDRNILLPAWGTSLKALTKSKTDLARKMD